MNIKPWREVAIPNDDVLSGKFQESEFAADINAVHRGEAKPAYQEAELFFSRTFITEGMRLLLDSVVQRLCGKGGDPVIQLQTAFGGGKTHTMLAVWHLARGEVPVSRLAGVSSILDAAGIAELPKARVAVIDGISMNTSRARHYGGQAVNTIWGVLAVELAGTEGYELVRANDEEGSSPDKETLIELLNMAGPSVILMDELVAYIREFEEGRTYLGGSYGSNITFIQKLTEAIKRAPQAILLASLPESEAEAGGLMGERALETLSKYFGRVEAVWKPVGTEEAFNIVRRRLFSKVNELAAEKSCEAFFELYRDQADHFPVETQKGDYLRRLKQAYPIHPELFDQLYGEWSTLDKFQRTRGVLQLMALAIHRLWQDDNRDGMILPGSMPLYDGRVRNKLINYLPGQGWDPILETDIDGERSEPFEIDKDSRFGAIQAARRVARSIFMGSAPSVGHAGVRGVDVRQVALGVTQPGQTVATYRDALKRLADRLHYLNSSEDRYWFDKRPNLRREMEERKRAVKLNEDVLPEVRGRVERTFGSSHVFGGVHVFAGSGDIPDDFELRLVVLSPLNSFSRTVDNRALPEAAALLEKRGEKPRQHRNRLIFLAPDVEAARRMLDQASTYLAWRSMRQAIADDRLVLDQLQARQVKEHVEKSEESLKRTVRETYRWILTPYQPLDRQGRPANIEWEARSLQPGTPSISQEIERVLRQEEDVIFEWSPVHLRTLLQKWFWKADSVDVSALAVWHAMCDYLYLPRLRSSRVLEEAIQEGISSQDYFGYATSVANGKYEGFSYGSSGPVHLDSEAVLIEPETAIRWLEEQSSSDSSSSSHREPEADGTGEDRSPNPDSRPLDAATTTDKSARPRPSRFYGTVELDPVTAQMKFTEIQREVLQHLQSAPNARLSVRIDIESENPDGYEEQTVRTVLENARALGFDGPPEFFEK